MKCFFALASSILMVTLASAQLSSYPDLAIVFARGTTRTRVLLSNINTVNPATLPFNPAYKTVVWFFGYYSDATSGNNIQSAFEAIGGYNFIIVDWSSYNHGTYVDAVKNISPIAQQYAASLVGLVQAGLVNVNNWYFVGHSLGSHLAGNTARAAKALSASVSVPRLTGLDPAGPLIYPPNSTVNNFIGLKKTDAVFVDTIHTDALAFGTGQSVGTVDFFPNNAANPQPGLPAYIPTTTEQMLAGQIPQTNWASHQRASGLFVESIKATNNNAFASKKCLVAPSVSLSVTCSQLEASASANMGFYASTSLSGNYFLATNGASPYSK